MLTPKEIEARKEMFRVTERMQLPKLHWLSFADPHKPQGEQFLGAIILKAPGFLTAIERAHELGINPGGEVQGSVIPEEAHDKYPESLRNRLLSLEELKKENLI